MDILIFVFVAASAFSFGMLLIFRPRDAFEIQRRFYAKINWRIEPISMKKELRNTRIMGYLLLVAILAACLYVYARMRC